MLFKWKIRFLKINKVKRYTLDKKDKIIPLLNG